MRKILSQEEIDKRTKRRGRILTLLMLLILLGSTAGYAVLSSTRDNSGSNNQDSSGQKQISDGRWILDYQGQQLLLVNSKQEVQNISVSTIRKASEFYGQQVYVSADSPGGYNELSYTLGLVSGKMQEACYGKCESNLPEKNCSSNLIVINQSSDVKRVYQQDNCIFIDGDLSSVDAFIYRIFS